jgi:hypothetical protein
MTCVRLINKIQNEEYYDGLYNLDENEYLTLRKNAYLTWQSKFNAEANYSELIYNMVQFSKNY